VIDPLIVLRWLHFAATALAAGTVLCLAAVAEPALRGAGADAAAFRRAARRLTWAALAVAAASGAAWLVWLASDIYGASLLNVCLHGGAWSVLTGTRFGLVWLARLVLAVLLAVLLPWPATRWVQLIAAALLLGLLAFIGHAGASPDGVASWQLGADILHLLAAGAWVGALPALALLLHKARREKAGAWSKAAAAAARRFSVIGMAAVGALLITGIVNTWYALAGPRDLIATGYGRLVLLKIGLFAAMVGIAAVNRNRLTPRLPDPAAAGALQRNTCAEIALGIVVFLFVGALGTLAPPAHDHIHIPAAPVPADAAYVHVHSSEAMADVTINPGRVGAAHARLLLMREDFSIFTAKDVTFMLIPQAGSNTPAISRPAKRLPDGAWQVDGLEIGQPGVWTVKLTIEPGTGAAVVLDAPVVIEP
jgi:putative copper resistance protein D